MNVSKAPKVDPKKLDDELLENLRRSSIARKILAVAFKSEEPLTNKEITKLTGEKIASVRTITGRICHWLLMESESNPNAKHNVGTRAEKIFTVSAKGKP